MAIKNTLPFSVVTFERNRKTLNELIEIRPLKNLWFLHTKKPGIGPHPETNLDHGADQPLDEYSKVKLT